MSMAVLLAQGSRGGGPPVEPFIIVGCLVLFAAAAVTLVTRSARRRRQEIEQRLGARGFGWVTFNRKNGDDRESAFAPFASITALRGGAKGLKWIARGRLAAREAAVASHQYMVYTGHGGHSITHTLVAILCDPDCAGWPPVMITRKRGWVLSAKARASVVETGDAEFDKRFRVRCTDAGLALAVLSPAVRAVIAEPQKSESWSITGQEIWVVGGAGRGVLCLMRQATARPEQLERMLGRLERLVDALDEPVRDGLGV